jgi:hypothetical protein
LGREGAGPSHGDRQRGPQWEVNLKTNYALI